MSDTARLIEVIEPEAAALGFELVRVKLSGEGEDRKAGRIEVPLANIQSAKLVLTDKLIAATRPLDTSGVEEIVETTEEEEAD